FPRNLVPLPRLRARSTTRDVLRLFLGPPTMTGSLRTRRPLTSQARRYSAAANTADGTTPLRKVGAVSVSAQVRAAASCWCAPALTAALRDRLASPSARRARRKH